ncbi:hypothetical protein D3C86_856690 [compost metagenome]
MGDASVGEQAPDPFGGVGRQAGGLIAGLIENGIAVRLDAGGGEIRLGAARKLT